LSLRLHKVLQFFFTDATQISKALSAMTVDIWLRFASAPFLMVIGTDLYPGVNCSTPSGVGLLIWQTTRHEMPCCLSSIPSGLGANDKQSHIKIFEVKLGCGGDEVGIANPEHTIRTSILLNCDTQSGC
jgi:hypothetical protein